MQSLSNEVTRSRGDGIGATAVTHDRVTTLRRLAQKRRFLAPLLVLAPLACVLVVDVARRGARLLEFDGYYRLTYSAAMVESVVVWGTLLYAASRRRGVAAKIYGVLFVVFFTLAVGGQRYFHDQYNAYLNVDVSLFASNLMDSVINQLFADIGNYALAKLPPFVFALVVLWLSRRWLRPKQRWAERAKYAAPVALVASLFVPTQHRHAQAATPDMLYMEAAGGLLRTQLGLTDESSKLRPRARASLPVTLKNAGTVTRKPNIVLFILESVRADAVCIAPGTDCKRTPYSDRVVPNRYPLLQMRSLDSSTAISLAVLWAGVGPEESREVLHTWPLVFDYAKAAGYDTAYWTSQNMLFGNARLWVKNLGVGSFMSATDIDPVSDLDMGAPESELAEKVNSSFDKLKEPFLAVIQLSNMHYPYFVREDAPSPFQPSSTSKAAEDNVEFQNNYLNGVHQEDRHVASMLRRIKESPLSANTVILYTSDHGEAFREHGQMGHTFSVLEEEVHVPGWIDAPDGLLTFEEQKNLAAKRHAFTFHVDLTATMLDLMGVWDDPGIAEYKSRMIGSSLLREPTTDQPVPMTNCAGVWSCAFENWGYMQKNMKLEARAWDSDWHCFDLAADPYETRNLGMGACGDLQPLALQQFHRLPGGDDRPRPNAKPAK
jgi:glucan phosphoethanolaminetransferase (alkaline phosphatase superfamily)